MCRCIRLTLSSNVSRSVDAPPGPAAALDSSTRFFVRFAWSFLPTSAADIPTSGPASNAPLGHQQPRPSTRGGARTVLVPPLPAQATPVVQPTTPGHRRRHPAPPVQQPVQGPTPSPLSRNCTCQVSSSLRGLRTEAPRRDGPRDYPLEHAWRLRGKPTVLLMHPKLVTTGS